MASIGTMLVNMIARTDSFVSGMKTSQKHLSYVNKQANATMASLNRLAGTFISLYAAQRLAKYSLNNAIQQEKAEIQLASALAKTGKNIDDLMTKYKAYATQIQNTTIYADDLVLSTMAYGKNLGISVDKMEEATTAAIGLAAKYSLDLKTSMMLVGRAALGQTQMLTRYGIVLGESLNAQDKFNALLKIGADSFYLAENAALTTEGSLSQAKNTISDLAEVIGNQMIPYLKEATNRMKELNDDSKNLESIAKGVMTAFAYAGAVILDVIGTVNAGFKQIIAYGMEVVALFTTDAYYQALTEVANGLQEQNREWWNQDTNIGRVSKLIEDMESKTANVTAGVKNIDEAFSKSETSASDLVSNMTELEKKAKSISEKFQDPAVKMQKQMDELLQMATLDLITMDTYNRAKSDLTKEKNVSDTKTLGDASFREIRSPLISVSGLSVGGVVDKQERTNTLLESIDKKMTQMNSNLVMN